MLLTPPGGSVLARATIRAIALGGIWGPIWFIAGVVGDSSTSIRALFGIPLGDFFEGLGQVLGIILVPMLALTIVSFLPFVAWEVHAARARPPLRALPGSLILLVLCALLLFLVTKGLPSPGQPTAKEVVDMVPSLLGVWLGLALPNVWLRRGRVSPSPNAARST